MFDLSPLGTQVQQQVWTANTVTAEWVLLCLSQHFLGSSNCSLSPALSTVGSAGSGKGQLQIPSGMLVLMAKSVVNFGLNSTVINFFFFKLCPVNTSAPAAVLPWIMMCSLCTAMSGKSLARLFESNVMSFNSVFVRLFLSWLHPKGGENADNNCDYKNPSNSKITWGRVVPKNTCCF